MTTSAAAALRVALLAANYTEEQIKRTLGAESPLDLLASHLTLAQVLDLSEARGLEPLVRLFYFCQPIITHELNSTLQPLATVEELARLGLVAVQGDHVIPRTRITPVEGLFVAHDPEDTATLQPDHVVGVGPAARSLAALTVRRQVESALDLGTGSGVQAMLLARHVRKVTATDISNRALALARLNADLNAVNNIEVLSGDLFAPVAGRTFDLIVANPPFVVSPERAYVFRDSGRFKDSISREVLQATPRFLNEGGFAHVLCSWICEDEEKWSAPVEQWLDGSGCDAWVLGNQVDGPLAYATQWNLPLLRKGADVFGDAVSRWTAFYRQQGIERICTGAVILRKRKARRNWMRKERMPRRPTGPAGTHILRVFEAQDHLSTVRSGSRMLDDVFSLVDGHWLDQRTVYRGGHYHTPPAKLHVENGVGLSGEVEPLATHVLFRMDGKRSVRNLVQEAARDTGVSKRELAKLALETIRELYALGLLARVPDLHDALF